MRRCKIAVLGLLMLSLATGAAAQTDNSFNATYEARYNGTGQGPSFDLGNVQPGDSGRWEVTVETQNNSNIWAQFNKTADLENGCNEPEKVAEPDCELDNDGELDEYIEFYAWIEEDGDFEKDGFEDEIPVIDSWTPLYLNGTINIFDGGEEHQIGVRWELPKTTGNQIQTDSATYNLSLRYTAPPREEGDFETGDTTPPSVSFSYSPSEPEEGENVLFEATAEDNVGITGYEWDWDDDGDYDESGSTASNSFAAGDHTVTLRVTDTSGNTATTSQTITVSASDSGDNNDGGSIDVSTTQDGGSSDGGTNGDGGGGGSISISDSSSGSSGNNGVIRFSVTDDQGDPLKGVTIVSDPEGDEETTDENGEASFNLPEGDYEFTLNGEGYQQLEMDENVDGDSTRTVSVTLQESEGVSEYRLTVTVLDENGDPIENANVTVNDSMEKMITNSDGIASTTLPEDIYSVEAAAEGYNTVQETVDLDQDKSTEIALPESSDLLNPDEGSGSEVGSPLGDFAAEPGLVGGGFFLLLLILLSLGVYRYYLGPWLAS